MNQAAARSRGTPTTLRPHRNLGLTAGQQWFAALGIAAALWLLWPDREGRTFVLEGPRTEWDGFLALGYRGIGAGAGDDIVSAQRFREHIDALRAAGYRPIRLEDARAFLADRRPLPARPILIILEDGRRETIEEAEAVLAPVRWPATFLTRTEPMERSNRYYPSWRDLRALGRTGRWSFGATAADAAAAEQVLHRRLSDASPLAFLLRPRPRRASVASAADGSPASFPVRLTSTDGALNPWGRSPRVLTRLRVLPGWSGEELVSRLRAQAPKREATVAATAADWIRSTGRVAARDGRVVVDPGERRAGEAWLAGSEGWDCLRGAVTLEARPDAQSWILLRSMPGGDAVRLGWTGAEVRLDACARGGRRRTIARALPPRSSRRITIAFDLFPNRIRFAVEGGGGPRHSVPLPAAPAGGMFGLAVWFPDARPGPVTFSRLRLEPRIARGIEARDLEDLPASDDRSADVVFAHGLEIDGDGSTARLGGAMDAAIAIRATVRGASLWAVLAPPAGDASGALRAIAPDLENALRRAGADGVLLDLRRAPPDVQGFADYATWLASSGVPVGLLVAPGAAWRRAEPSTWTRCRWIALPETADHAGLPPDRVLLY